MDLNRDNLAWPGPPSGYNGFFNPIITALRFAFERNNRIPAGPLPSYPPQKSGTDNAPFATTWLGHSTLLIRMAGFWILTDPVLVEKVTPAGPKRFNGTLSLTPDRLPPVDLVIISHDHYDHLNRETIRGIQSRVGRFILPRGVGERLADWGVPRGKIIELNWWETCTPLAGIRVTATPSQHFSGRGPFDRNRTLWASWVIRSPQLRIFFSGDSGYFDGFTAIGDTYGPFDMTILECGAYDRAWHKVHMRPEETVMAHKDLKGCLLHPVHWGTFNLALHPWYEPMERLTEAAKAAGIPIATPGPGQTLAYKDFHTAAGTPWWRPAMDQQIGWG